MGGWRDVALVDVVGHVSFTLWLSGCNFKCPWCANYEIALGLRGFPMSVSEVVELLVSAKPYVDYLHVTGGEPLLQKKPLEKLLLRVRRELGLKLSVDTNGSLPEALRKLVPYLHHVAIDLKAPLENEKLLAKVIGVEERLAEEFADKISESLAIAARSVPFLELRTTLVPNLISRNEVVEIARLVSGIAERAAGRVIYVVQQFIPYEGVRGAYSRERATPARYVEECAKEAANLLRSVEVYYRTLEEGIKRVSVD